MKKITTVFAIAGTVHEYQGSLLELRTTLSEHEWKSIIVETVKYRIFMECVKKHAIKKLDERWSKSEKEVLKGLKQTIEKMQQLDPLLVATVDQNQVRDDYTRMVNDGCMEVLQTIEMVQNLRTPPADPEGDGSIVVSNI